MNRDVVRAAVSIDDIRPDLLSALPHLRAFAMSLTGDIGRADDLVQETIVRALGHLHQFEAGTNLQGWMFTILRNQFHTSFRRQRRECEDPDGTYALKCAVPPSQEAGLDFADLRLALAKLAPRQREALVLVAAEGMTYEEVAEICCSKIGTIKSRVNRARRRLADLLGYCKPDEIGPSAVIQAALIDAESRSPRPTGERLLFAAEA